MGRMEQFVGLLGRCEGKKHLERPRRRCVDNIKIALREMGDCIDLPEND